MPGKAAKVKCSEKQLDVLKRIECATTASRRLVQRTRIILLAMSGKLNMEIANEVGLCRQQVGVWRGRWADSIDSLLAIECSESRAALQRAIEEILSDAPRSGRSCTFTGEQVTQVVALACESPEQSGRPVAAWSQRELTDEAIERAIASSISSSTIGRFLCAAAMQPHKSRYWLNTREKDPKVFQEKVEAVCNTYLKASRRFYQENTHTVCVDEMSGLQALERLAKTLPTRPGSVRRIEYEYKRHGTLCLIGSWDVVLGRMLAPTIQPTRTEADFALHIRNTISTDLAAGWIFVVDNLNTHCSETLVRDVARLEGIDEDLLGKKNRTGILKSMATRQKFLADESHRVRFVYLPKHSSWLNQIEIVFGIVARRVMRGGEFKSLDALSTRLHAFIDYFNETSARPFRWTYTGRPTVTKKDHRPKTWKEKWAKQRQMAQTSALVT